MTDLVKYAWRRVYLPALADSFKEWRLDTRMTLGRGRPLPTQDLSQLDYYELRVRAPNLEAIFDTEKRLTVENMPEAWELSEDDETIIALWRLMGYTHDKPLEHYVDRICRAVAVGAAVFPLFYNLAIA